MASLSFAARTARSTSLLQNRRTRRVGASWGVQLATQSQEAYSSSKTSQKRHASVSVCHRSHLCVVAGRHKNTHVCCMQQRIACTQPFCRVGGARIRRGRPICSSRPSQGMVRSGQAQLERTLLSATAGVSCNFSVCALRLCCSICLAMSPSRPESSAPSCLGKQHQQLAYNTHCHSGLALRLAGQSHHCKWRLVMTIQQTAPAHLTRSSAHESISTGALCRKL
jgi:hypothetical protein